MSDSLHKSGHRIHSHMLIIDNILQKSKGLVHGQILLLVAQSLMEQEQIMTSPQQKV